MPYDSDTGLYERRTTTVIDASPDGDTVYIAIDAKLDQAADDTVTDLNHHKENGNHYPATSTHTDSRFLRQTPAGVVAWADGVPAPDAALKDFSNVADGGVPFAKLASGILPAQIAGVAYVKTNILGTVSQSGGVPTGAVIERGSNANGSYVRFADGTQICVGVYSAITTSETWLGAIYSKFLSVIFPASFTATPSCSCGAFQWTAFTGFVSAVNASTTVVQIGAFSGAINATCTVNYVAVGRWF
jgi:hypothetical protein